MKQSILQGAGALLVLSAVLLQPSCRKSDNTPDDPNNPPVVNGMHADTLNNHLLFLTANKRPGRSPAAPAGGSYLKTSLRDTLYLTDEVLKPIRFLHKDTTKNVGGVFIQVLGSNGSTASSFYDVPEIVNQVENDTVSVILVGINPNGLKPPHTTSIRITPYDEGGNPLAEVIRPVKVVPRRHDVPRGPNPACGLELGAGMKWDWEFSYRPPQGSTLSFWSEPSKVWSAAGQEIKGSCCNGHSEYGNCPGKREPNASLHFATYYQILFETFVFSNNGTFLRQTMEDSPVPLPLESDFCAGGSGKIKESLKHTVYNGNWTIVKAQPPTNQGVWLENDTLELQLLTTSSTPSPGGYGNAGGLIHQLDCSIGAMVLMQVSREGGQPLIKVYHARREGEAPWWYNL